jgi:hypothetical protein
VDIARIGKPRCNGDAARSADRTRRQRRHHARLCAANPLSHTPNSIPGSRLVAIGTETNSGAGAGGANGWLIRSTITGNCGCTKPAVLRHSTWLAILTNIENGTRNFTDAASHRPCRTAARFLFSVSVTTATTQKNSVDCHK